MIRRSFSFSLALLLALVLSLVLSATGTARAEVNTKNYAPGFTQRESGSRVVVVPPDMELFSLSAGGVVEPRADWTATAQSHFKAALAGHKSLAGARAPDLTEADMDGFAPLNALHGAVARSIALHQFGGLALPTKGGRLDWSLGDAVQPLRARTGADYALFFWVRDSYASSERKAAMVALALVGVGVSGGVQVGYASLVDLHDGRVVWFNRLLRGSGDLREAKLAEETVEALLSNFPPLQ